MSDYSITALNKKVTKKINKDVTKSLQSLFPEITEEEKNAGKLHIRTQEKIGEWYKVHSIIQGIHSTPPSTVTLIKTKMPANLINSLNEAYDTIEIFLDSKEDWKESNLELCIKLTNSVTGAMLEANSFRIDKFQQLHTLLSHYIANHDS